MITTDKHTEYYNLIEQHQENKTADCCNVNTISSVWQELRSSLILIAAIFITTSNL